VPRRRAARSGVAGRGRSSRGPERRQRSLG
jgi:hypothetical protein